MTKLYNKHANAVELNGNGLLILGPSGCGKTTLMLELLELGGCLIADDQTSIGQKDNQLLLSPPSPLKGLIELYGVGIIQLGTYKSKVPLTHIIQLDPELKTERLPTIQQTELLGKKFPLIKINPSLPKAALKIKMLLNANKILNEF